MVGGQRCFNGLCGAVLCYVVAVFFLGGSDSCFVFRSGDHWFCVVVCLSFVYDWFGVEEFL